MILAVDALPEMATEPLAPEATVELLNQARRGDAFALERLLGGNRVDHVSTIRDERGER